MKNEYYYVYCKGILGVKTNIRKFKWVYGSVAPAVSMDEYEKCVVKFEVILKPENKLNDMVFCDQRFQAYAWNKENKMISCRRTLFKNLNIGYNIKMNGNTVSAEVGEHYYKIVKNRTMNLHGMYYLLSDLANTMLLKNGLLTLYASAVYNKSLKKGVLNFAPPNTGKTLTATKICELPEYELVGEDVVITDGKKVYSCPWTSTYRTKRSTTADNAGTLRKTKRIADIHTYEECDLTDLIVLSLGKKKIDTNKQYILKQISILNGYLFSYYSSPIIKLFEFFDEEYCKPWNRYSKELLESMVAVSNCYAIQSENSLDFSSIINKIFAGKII